MSRDARAMAGLATASLLITAGAATAWGYGYGLMILGALLLTWFLTLYDIDADSEE